MKYRALRDGYLDRYIHAGETFDWNGKKPSWAEYIGPAAKAGKSGEVPGGEKSGKAPDTQSNPEKK